MKSRGEKLSRHYQQTFDYWLNLVPHRPPYVVLCNFDEFWIYDFNTQLQEPMDRCRSKTLSHAIPRSIFFTRKVRPIFGNNWVEVTREAARIVANVYNSPRANFQTEKGSDILRANGRCLFKTETLPGHGCNSVEEQQGNRIEVGCNFPHSSPKRLAQTSPAAGKTRFYFPTHKLAIFVDGCFWHGCRRHLRMPQSNRAYWKRKIAQNMMRDRKINRVLRETGWRVVRIWEHSLRVPDSVARRIKSQLMISG